MARAFDATDDVLLNSGVAALDTAKDWLMWGWMYQDDWGEAGLADMYSMYTGGGSNYAVEISGRGDIAAGKAFDCWQIASGANARYTTVADSLVLNKWQFVGVWFDDSANKFNGVWIGDLNTVPTKDTSPQNDSTLTGTRYAVAHATVGNLGTTGLRTVNGQLSDIGVYQPTSITAAQAEAYCIARWKGITPPSTDLYGHWPLNSGIDSGTSNIELDYGPNGYDLSTTSDSTRPSPAVGPSLAHMRRFGGMPI
jgi:hypothetical protein